MKVLTAAEMAVVDQATVAAGTSMRELMERAGEAVAAFCLRRYPEARQVLVLCGKGNNGGDGFVAARLLAGEGVGVRVLLVGRQVEVQAEAAEALGDLTAATDEGVVAELAGASADELAELLAEADVILDAVVGTGFKPPLRGDAVALRDALRQVQVPVVAVDLPSGWDADSYAEASPDSFRADAVITFTAPKIAHVFGQLTSQVLGPVVVADIGSPKQLIVSNLNLHWTGQARRLVDAARPANSNKGRFGHVLLVGGSRGTAGAPSMASLACLRAGAGLVTAAVPADIMNLVAAIAPELMMRGLLQDAAGSAAISNLQPDVLAELLKGIKVLALGPGLSTRGEAGAFARELVAMTKDLPLVLDADGLNAFDADHVADLNGAGRTLVLTPHPGEMARLTGLTVAQVEADRVRLARSFATQHNLTLVLKGWRTLVAHPDGSIAVNTSGNPALSKGGSGDTLTGIIAAMLAQFPDHVAEAVEAAVYLHGLAADLLVQTMDEKFVLATDVTNRLSEAFRYSSLDADDLTWICGVKPAQEPAV